MRICSRRFHRFWIICRDLFHQGCKTGEYLACNQAFAEYAHKKAPSEVVGLKLRTSFDEETANRFIKDDNMALSMDEPLDLL